MAKRHARKTTRIAIITGTRAEYGLLQSTMRTLAATPRVELQVVATGMHLLRPFGYTVRQIERDGFTVAARVPMQRGDDSPTDQAEGLGRGVARIARFFASAGTHIALVLGDRIEAMAGALAARATGVTLAHLHGGDVAPGDFDGPMRDAITQLANLHLTASKRATQRVIAMGANPRNVLQVGAPGLDRIRELGWSGHPARSNSRPYALVVQHAYGRPPREEQRVARLILDEVARAGLRRVIIQPNSDRGHRGVIAAIDAHMRESSTNAVEVHVSLPRDDFLRALIRADLLIGNSSTAFIEAPFAGTPALDIGDRQRGREPGGPSVLHAPESATAIRRALGRALKLSPRPGQPTVYGRGDAGAKIARLLAKSV